ncbi:MAG: hypothetical protein JSV19_13065 [Phycisphaerales bacterium]|nr:MAG: hypothetical protein JSV19_13065 [Phycisphaerales bacterium]
MSLLYTTAIILGSPTRFVRTLPTFYDPRRAMSFWGAIATISGSLHLARFVLFLQSKNVRTDIAFITGGIAALLVIACVWATEVIIARGLWRLHQDPPHGGKSYWYWRGVTRFGIVYFPLMSGLIFLQSMEILPTVLTAARTDSDALKGIAWGLVGLKLLLVLAWWQYLDTAIMAASPSRRRIATARVFVLLVTMIAIIVFSTVGATLRFLA